jgi:tetratricopeptide (TPR) repeat protein
MQYQWTEWDEDVDSTPDEEYQSLVRSLRRKMGFGLFFVRCSPVDGQELIKRVRADVPQKQADVLELKEPIANLIDLVKVFPNIDNIKILFVVGLEKSLVEYIRTGYGGQGDYYNLDTVPPILSHLNWQRENFRDKFPHLCFVFLLPQFAIKYILRRAPDFYDWGSGKVDFPTSEELVEQESSRVLWEDYEDYLQWTPQQRKERIIQINELLLEPNQTQDRQCSLLYEQGSIFYANKQYEEAIASYNKAIEIKPSYLEAWSNRGFALRQLGKYEEAIASYDKVINIDPENASTYYARGLTRYELGDVAGAAADYIEAIRLNPNYAGDRSEKLELLLENIHKESNTSFCTEDITPIEGYWFENIIGDESYSLIFIKHSISEDSKDKLAITGLNIQENSIFRRFEADCISVDKNKNNTVFYYYKASTKLFKQDRRGSYTPGFGTITFSDIDEHKSHYLKAKGSFIDSVDNKVERTKVIAKSFKWHRLQQEDIPEEIILLFENKENEQCLDCVKNFIGNNIHTWNSRGDILRQLDRYEEAIASYDRSLAIKPDFYEAWDNLGIALFELGRYEEAIASYDKALAINPNFHYAWDNRGDALSELGKYKEAIDSYDKALAIKSDDRYAWDNRGDALSELGRYEEAIGSYDKALAIKPDDHDTLNNRGISLDELLRYEEAIASYDKALAIKPNFHYAWNNRGDSLRQLLRYEEALASYNKAVAIQPNFHYAWDNRGDVLSELDRYEEAIDSYDKALAAKPDFYFTWHNRGTALGGLGRYEEAILSYDRALEIKPDFHEAWSNRGFALFNLGKYEEAINSYEKALEIKPDEPKFYYNKACAYSLLNAIELAVENLQKAIQLNPEECREMVESDSDFDNIRHDPRFQALMQ